MLWQAALWSLYKDAKSEVTVMTDKNAIYEFAAKWYRAFNDSNFDAYRVFDNIGFADECKTLGFQMDCGHSFCEAFPDKNVMNDWHELKSVIYDIDDVMLLGTAIFSEWRYFNHWANCITEGDEAKNRLWFSVALGRLMALCEEKTAESDRWTFAEIDAKVESGENLTPEMKQLFEEQPEKMEAYKYKLWDS